MHEFSFEVALRNELYKNNLPFDGSFDLTPGKYHSFNSIGICQKKCCRYRIFEGYTGAQIRCWRRDINHFWFYKDLKTLTPIETKKLNRERQDSAELRQKEQKEAILLAREQWWLSQELSQDNPYVLRKKIIPYQARQYNNAVLLPLYNSTGEVVSNQKIYPDGAKRMATGAPFTGCFLFLNDNPGHVIFICEGWATGCSIQEATGQTACIAFNDSNLVKVSQTVKQFFPNKKIIICGDKGNSGIKYASLAADSINTSFVIPEFQSNHEGTDFNDLAELYGNKEVTFQIYK